MSSWRKVVIDFEKKAKERNVPEETVMAYLVEISQKERYDLYLHFDEEIPNDLITSFTKGMERILNGEPMAHVLGYSWFYGYQIFVNEDVLIPRYETEELCAHILNRIDRFFSDKEQIDVADVGTGSGAIAITLAKEEKKCHLIASDISKEAIQIAKNNALFNQADIQFYVGNMLDPLLDHKIKLDILVCNPPYIPKDEEMESSVIDYEPHIALFGGEDGLKYYREVLAKVKDILRDKAIIAFEIAWNQKSALSKLVAEFLPSWSFEVVKDMNGKDRMLFIYKGITR